MDTNEICITANMAVTCVCLSWDEQGLLQHSQDTRLGHEADLNSLQVFGLLTRRLNYVSVDRLPSILSFTAQVCFLSPFPDLVLYFLISLISFRSSSEIVIFFSVYFASFSSIFFSYFHLLCFFFQSFLTSLSPL